MSFENNKNAGSQEGEFYALAQHDLVSLALFKPDSLTKILEIISVDNFADEKMFAIMGAIVSIHRQDLPVSVVSVAAELEKVGELDFVGGVAFLSELFFEGQKISFKTPPVIIANAVKELSVKNKVKELLSSSMKEFNHDSGVSALGGIEKVQSYLSEQVLSLNDNSSTVTAKEFVVDYENLLSERKKVSEENKEVSGGLQGIPTLLPSLNKYTSGFTSGQLITVGAETGVGKSVFAIMCAISALQANKSVMFFSLEMSEKEIFDRIYANMAAVKLNKIKSGELDDDELQRISAVTKKLSASKLKVDADPKETIDSIRSKATRQKQSEDGLDMIIIDYLQLISSSGTRFNSRQEFVADLSRNVKLMAKSLHIPIMILVQLNRKPTDAEDERPNLDRIRESAAIAQDSDIVVLLHRETSVDNKVPQTLVLLEKNRNGESKKVIRCHTELAYSDFREVKNKNLGEDDSTQNTDGGESSHEKFLETGTTNPNDFYSDDFIDNLDDEYDFFDD